MCGRALACALMICLACALAILLACALMILLSMPFGFKPPVPWGKVLVLDMTRRTCMFKLHLQVNSDAVDTEHLEQESFVHLGMHEVS